MDLTPNLTPKIGLNILDPYEPFKVKITDKGFEDTSTLPLSKKKEASVPAVNGVDVSLGGSGDTQQNTQFVQQPTPEAGKPLDAKIDIDPLVKATLETSSETMNQIRKLSDPIIQNIDHVASAAEQTAAPVISQAEQAIAPIAQEAAQATESVVSPIVETTKEVGQDVLDYLRDNIGDVNVPISGLGINLDIPLKGVSDYLGVDVPSLSTDASVKKSDGSGYGEVAIGNSGYAIDASKSVDNIYNSITENTALAGTSGKDFYDLTTNPSAFISNKSTEAATSTLTNMGMDSGAASNVINVLKDPVAFVETQGKEAATNFIAQGTGMDTGLIGTGLEVLSAKDVGQAAQKVAETMVADTIKNTVYGVMDTVVPGLGSVVKVIDSILPSCKLSTAAYAQGLITKEELMSILRYRIDIQSKQRMGHQAWIGYRLWSEPIYKLMLVNKSMASFVTKLIVNPWVRHSNALQSKKQVLWQDVALEKLLLSLSVATYYALYPISRKIGTGTANFMGSYKTIIRFVESCKQRSAQYA